MPRRSPHALLAPLDPARYRPSPERPVRAKARHLDAQREIAPHSHPWAQVAISVSGVARVTAGDATYLVPGWRAVWIPPGIEHMVAAVEAAELRTLYIHADAMPHWQACRVIEVSPLLRELVLQMDVTMDADVGPPVAAYRARPPEGASPGLGRPGAGLAADSARIEREHLMGRLVLHELQRAAPVRLGIELPHDKRLRALCEAVIAEPTRHATLADWARESGASTRTVARLFRQQLATSFGPWRQQVLLARALTLAAQGKPMGVIAADLGYASASAFTAMVRRSVGAPPGRFFGSAM
jgi:AraC-like DNA-binding protein/uncharacterized membrane protein